MTAVAALSGLAVLALAWGGADRALPHHPFTAHMTAHMAIVALAAPLLAWAAAGTRVDPVRAGPAVLFSPIPASMLELIAVWGWHAPALHTAARTGTSAYVGEQATFLIAGLVLWGAVLGGDSAGWRTRRFAGVGALLFTSIHMTLLGALFALTPRVFYGPGEGMPSHAPLDLQLGGAAMLVIGGGAYMAGALAILGSLLAAAPTTRLARAGCPSPTPDGPRWDNGPYRRDG